MIVLQFLFFYQVFSDIHRGDDEYEADFIVVNKGRMLHEVLMYLEELHLGECMTECLRHLSCVTINYHFESKQCELVDMDYDKTEADEDEPGWLNYGTLPEGNNF